MLMLYIPDALMLLSYMWGIFTFTTYSNYFRSLENISPVNKRSVFHRAVFHCKTEWRPSVEKIDIIVQALAQMIFGNMKLYLESYVEQLTKAFHIRSGWKLKWERKAELKMQNSLFTWLCHHRSTYKLVF